jgi:hypothetical protein
VKALEKSSALDSGGAARTWFFLAMSDWQKGEKDQARRWYEKAVAWTAKDRAQDAELLRFRSEAAALLGVIDHPAPTGNKKEENPIRPSKP